MPATLALAAVACGGPTGPEVEDASCTATYDVVAAAGVDHATLGAALSELSAATRGLIRFRFVDQATQARAVRVYIDPNHPEIRRGYSAHATPAFGVGGAGEVVFQSPELTRHRGLMLHELGHLWLGADHSAFPDDLLCSVNTAGQGCAIHDGRTFSERERRSLYEAARAEVRPPTTCS